MVDQRNGRGWILAMLPRVAAAIASLTRGYSRSAPPGLKRAAIRTAGGSLRRSEAMEGRAELCGKSLASQARHEMDAPLELFAGAKRGRVVARKFGLFHESARKFTKVRTDQARKSSMLRIVTGEALFLTTDGHE